MATNAIDEALRKAARHWSIDGIAELLAGSLVLLWGMAVSAQQIWPSRVTTLLASVLPIVSCVALAVFHRGITSCIEGLKARWTYPRVGYVKLPEPSRARKVSVAILALVVAGGVAVLVRRSGDSWSVLMPMSVGVVYASGAALLWVRLGIRRLLAYAVLALAAGALAQWALPARLGAGVVMCAAGVSWSVGGALVLRELLRQPPLTEDQG